VPEAAGDARKLLAQAMRIDPARLTLHMQDGLQASEIEGFRALIARREGRVPVSHLTGSRLFWAREFLVTADVLDPRPETEALVAAALEEPFTRVLDLGVGSGCLLVTLLAERPGATGQGLDLSPAALLVAERNAARHGVRDRAGFARSDWLERAEGRFDLIVSNPPYIALGEMAGLEPEVRDHEPRLALTDDGDGLGAFRAILAGAAAHLAPGGRLLLEHGAAQADAVAAIGRASGFAPPRHILDLDGRRRAVLFRAP
jgi:release factor glutamine methyltransferase